MSVGFQEEKAPKPVDRYVSTVALAAAIIAAIRLGRLPDSELSATRVDSTIKQCILLARTIVDEARRLV